MHHIMDYDGSPRYDHLAERLIENQAAQRRDSPTDVLLNDWQTQLPTVGEFLHILEEAGLFDVSNFVRDYVGEPPVSNPDRRIIAGEYSVPYCSNVI